jgi:hypothetical protein
MIETNLIEDLRRLSPPGSSWRIWATAAAGLALSAWAWTTWRRRPGASQPPVPPPAMPDLWEETLSGLERLLPLLRPDQSRAYGIASTALLRRYLEGRYGLQAPRLATEEFLAAAARSPALPERHRDALADYLRLCDLLKFGRAVAETAELQQLHVAAVQFVTTSRPVPATPPAPGTGTPSPG